MEVRKVTNESKKPITTDNHIIALSMESHFTSLPVVYIPRIPRPPLFGHLPPPPCSPSSSTSQPHHPLFPSDHYLLPLKPILILRECLLLIFLFHPTVGRGLCLAQATLNRRLGRQSGSGQAVRPPIYKPCKGRLYQLLLYKKSTVPCPQPHLSQPLKNLHSNQSSSVSAQLTLEHPF